MFLKSGTSDCFPCREAKQLKKLIQEFKSCEDLAEKEAKKNDILEGSPIDGEDEPNWLEWTIEHGERFTTDYRVPAQSQL